MNKVFKVVYSKSKGCYVVVPETAKNNNGKKKVLASVLAGLALVGGAVAGNTAHATVSGDGSINTDGSRINIAANARPNNSVGVNSIVVGYQNTTDNEEGTTALGANNQAYGNSGLAVGNENYANGGAATAIGAGNEARAAATVALGNKNNANATSAVAVGNYNNQNYTIGTHQTTPKQAGNYSTAVGSYNAALGDNSVSVGTMNTSRVADTVTVGQNNDAKTMGGIAIGKNNMVDSTNGGTNFGETRNENSQIAIGRDNTATHLDTIAIGRDTHATGSGATALGARADASGNNSIAIGQSGKTSPRVIASGVNSIAIGMQSQTEGESGVALGAGTRANGQFGVAVGHIAKANATKGTALGDATNASIAEGVALGSSSVTTTDKGVLGYNPSDPHERKYAPLTGTVQTATTAAVSIGNGQQMTRQLTGLAAGTADTDAVNVAQLKNVGVAVTGNTGKSDFLTDGGKLNVIGTGRVSTVAAHDGAKDSRITVGFDDTGMVKAGKNVTVDEKTVDGRTTYTINATNTAAKYDFLTNAKANGGNLDGTAKPATVASGNTVNYAAGKNLTVKQDIDQSIGEQTYTYSLNSDLGGITSITNNGGTTMHFGPDNISITGGNLDLGDNNITNLKSGGDVINNAANIGDVNRISKANEKHIKPGEYAVDNNGKVTMTYLDGNNKDVPNETAVITGIAKQDLSNINNGGKTVIKNLAKESIDMENGKNTTASHRDVNGVKTFKVDVEGDLNDITSITNKAGDGKVVFGGNQTVNVAGDHNISLNAKAGDITGLTNVTLDAPDFATRGRAATEEQLKIVNNGFNNTVGLTGNTGATELQRLNKQGGLSFGVVGANNGEYIKTTASGSNVVADLSDSAKNKLNSTVEVQGKNAAKVTSNVVQNADGSSKTIYTVDVNNVTPTAASTEKVQAKADVAGSSDKNIAKVAPKAGDQFGEAGATYEVNVSRNDVKDAAREAVTVNNANNKNNPITVTPVQDETNHNTTYQVTFDGDKAAKQIPLTYKANGTNEQKVTLDKGLNFTNGRNTTASVDAEGVVKYDVNKNLVDINSISNTTNGPKMEFGPNSINITGGPINMGDQNITNLKSGGDVENNAANIGDVTRISKANDLHIAPTASNRQGETTTSYAYDAASKSVTLKYNDGNGANQAGTVAKIDLSGLADQIKDGYSFSTDAKGNVVGNHAVTPVANGKTVSYAAGKNLTVAQNIDNATGEHTYTYALSNDVDLTPNGSLKIGDTILNNGGLTINNGPSVTKTGINAGDLNITNVKAGVNDTDAVNVKQLKDARTVVTSNDNSVTVNKTENGNQVTYDLHVAPGAAQSVWNVKSTGNTTADSEATAKTITDGKTVEMAAGKNLTVKQTSNNDGAKVEFGLAGDLTNIKTIKNEGPATFTIGGNEFKFDGGNVNMGDNNITNLKSGGDVVNNAANIGDVKRISKANDIHIKDKTYTVNADKTVTLEYVDGNDGAVNKTAKIDLSNLPTGDKAAIESVVKKSATTGDTNIADITVADGKQTGDANAKYEVNVSRNAVKDAAREAVTVNNANNSNNPITVTPVQDETNHNTTYQVTFDGDKAAKQIPLTYKANGSNDQKVTLDKGLNFTNGSNTTASVAADGVVKYDLNNNVNLTPNGSLTIGDTVVNNGGLTISGGPSVLKTGINAGNLNITNVKAGVNDTDAVNVKQLKDARTVVTSNDNS
ncbi:ESPR-type extended signal peptide-containing protein, partial [Veillonella sp.]|uniref:beta strand repeat-containing protein n=1 Tax=Veillonella sp. TaxID=1926307 RepID=UPI0025D67C8A